MLMPRQSTYPQHQASGAFDSYPQPSAHLISSLQHCVTSTASCVSTMREATDLLEYAISDHARLMTVLKSQRHFDLVSQRDIESAREHVAGEVRPHVEDLCRLATAGIAKQERKAVSLKNRAEALQQRLANLRSIDEHQAKLANHEPEPRDEQAQREQRALQQSLAEQSERLAQLRAKKDALLATADKLENEIAGHV